MRGGSWNNNENNVRCANRNNNNPNNENNDLGFRVVLASHGFLLVLLAVDQEISTRDSAPVTACAARFESRCSQFLSRPVVRLAGHI